MPSEFSLDDRGTLGRPINKSVSQKYSCNLSNATKVKVNAKVSTQSINAKYQRKVSKARLVEVKSLIASRMVKRETLARRYWPRLQKVERHLVVQAESALATCRINQVQIPVWLISVQWPAPYGRLSVHSAYFVNSTRWTKQTLWNERTGL